MLKICEDTYYKASDDLNFEELFEYKATTSTKKITYFDDILAFDIETSSFKEFDPDSIRETDDAVYHHLLGTKIRISQQMFSDIPDLNVMRRALFGKIYFSKNEGISVDSLYHELNNEYPYYFPDDIINPSDMLERIIDVFNENCPEKVIDDEKRGVMYVWQLAINGRVIIGRTWDEFVTILDQISEHFGLNKNKRMIVFVHSLSFEFQWMQHYFEWEKVFAVAPRKPVFALTKSGIEFRCSYILSNLSLAKLAESCTTYKIKKLVGDLDYDLIRHQETPLTDIEIHYCINDVLIVSIWVWEQIQQTTHKHITELPLTCTGYCRNFTRNICLSGHGLTEKNNQYYKYHEMMQRLTISGPEELEQLQRAFMGGFTHTNVRWSGKTIDVPVDSYDLTSAYPATCCEKFPMSRGKVVKITSYKELNHYCSLYFCIFDVEFEGITAINSSENYLSCSKCFEEVNGIENNGRLVSADKIKTTICNIDYSIIKKCYRWKHMKIGTCRVYRQAYLPREIIMAILTLYKDKTELKHKEGFEEFYQRQKGLLNSVYGMMVTNIIQPEHTYDNTTGWGRKDKPASKAIQSYNKSKKRFLFYPWGIAITAYVRATLWNTGILKLGDRYIYSDTDSLKVISHPDNDKLFEAYNRIVKTKFMLMCKHYNIPFEMTCPKNIDGISCPLGYWDKETSEAEGGHWKRFKSLGAKRYLLTDGNGKLHLTVAGVNKKKALPYLIDKYGKEDIYDHFNKDLKIPGKHSGKLTHYYIDDHYTGYVTDYLGKTIKYDCRSAVYMEKASYNFSIPAQYLEYINKFNEEDIIEC